MTSTTSDRTPPTGAVQYHPGAGDAVVDLVPDARRFSVAFGQDRVPLSKTAADTLRDRSTPVREVAHYGIRVYDGPDRQRRDASVVALNREPAVDLAAPVMHRHTPDGDEVYVTRRVVVQFSPDVTEQEAAAMVADLGAEILKPLGYAPQGYLLQAAAESGGLGAFALAEGLRASGRVIFAHPDLVSQRHRRTLTVERPTALELREDRDAALPQWHLDTARVRDAWSLTRGSSSIVVAVLDDGVDVGHPEFSGRIVAQHDFAEGSDDASPKSDEDKHGTAVAGVAVAAGLQASGSAPECSLMAVRSPSTLGDADEAEMFQWAADQGADVISCSWGPADGTGQTDPLPGSTQAAIHYCVTAGRHGKGIPVCWAAGNGNESVDVDGYAANPDVMAIAALNSSGSRSWYSDKGAALWVTAPSSGDRDAGETAITTVDRQGAAGYNDGSQGVPADYTNTFGGTSSATPLVAGIVGLMLSANPELTVDEVRTALRDSATKVGSGYDAAGHSTEFGYGLVNAFEAVRHAQAAAGQVTPAPGRPSIVGPSQADRSGPAPQFEVDPGTGGSFYAVEVANDSALLDGGDHAADPGFYASWQDSAFLAANPYVLPDEPWQRLRSADRLSYRVWCSSSADSWTDVRVSTDNSDSGSAPSMELVGDQPDGGTTGGTTGGNTGEDTGGDTGGNGTDTGGDTGGTASSGRAPSISGPAELSRSGSAPEFEVDPGDGPATFYAVEVATDPSLFDDASHPVETGWYGSWTDSPFLSANPYALPDAVWQQLGASAGQLYYRAWFSSSDSSWSDAVTTTTSADAASAPSITLTDGGEERSRRDAPERPVLEADENLWRRSPSR